MPFEIDLGKPPAGYALKGAHEKDEQVPVQFMEFTSTEDGQHFIQRLEGFPSTILAKLQPRICIEPSQVDSMLAIIDRAGGAAIYVNELRPTVTVRVNQALAKGERVSKAHIVEVNSLELGVPVRSDSGVLLLFSVGWRKGLFYDFGPISGPSPQPRRYDLPILLGRAYCHVLFHERFEISEEVWEKMFASKWFPFAAMRNELVEQLIGRTRSGLSFDDHTQQVGIDLKERLPEFIESWKQHSAFAAHFPLLDRAVAHFLASDYLSCTALLFPRIEGILRTYQMSTAVKSKPTTKNLADAAVSSRLDDEQCLLLPRRFAQYLRDVYFADFDPSVPSIEVSRHSVAHGVADPAQFNQKSAIIGIMVVHQLFYFFQQGNRAGC